MTDGRFGVHGGQYIPETLMNAVLELEEAYLKYKDDPEFNKELEELLNEYAGRPSRLYYAAHMTEDLGGAKVYLKREDLNHTGSHKINNVLGQVLLAKKMGKTRPEQELNCGACGYNTCREKAIAVYLNKAELTMCVPYMKERAESLSNYVLSETPNITIMVDDEMNIIEFNKAAEECFKISRREALEKGLFELIDSSDFQFVLETKQPITNKKVHYKEYGITTEQSIIYIDKQNIVMGIFKDITKEEREQENLYDLRVETMEMAQKVIDKQMVAAQQIASLLGETTAETKVTLTKLKNMIVFDGDE